MAIQLNFVDFVSLLQLSHSSPTLAWKHSFEISLAHSARAVRRASTFEIYARSSVLIICSRYMRIKGCLVTDWDAEEDDIDHIDLLTLECSSFYPREVLHALYRPHCYQVDIFSSHFQIKILHI